MSATVDPTAPKPGLELQAAVEAAAGTIAPTWPLDRWIAVNPFWAVRGADLREAAARLAVLGGVRTTMPRAFYRERWQAGEFAARHLEAAIDADDGLDPAPTVDQLVAALDRDATGGRRLPLLSDFADRRRPQSEPRPWREVVVDQVSQHLAAWFDRGQGSWRSGHDRGLYASWRDRLAGDRGIPTRHGHAAFAARVMQLPDEPLAAIAAGCARFGLDDATDDERTVWFEALLGSVRGWASWCAFERWQAALDGRAPGPGDAIVHLLAIRLSWEVLLLEEHGLDDQLIEWRLRLSDFDRELDGRRRAQRVDWLLQHALELAYQERLCRGLAGAPAVAAGARPATPRAQAVFCIDVRSERLRRALEQAGGGDVATRGFAGFFGLPVAHRALGTTCDRPQLPGLLAPARTTGEHAPGGDERGIAARRRTELGWRQLWQRFRAGPTSAFTFVEACGLLYLPDLLRCGFGRGQPSRLEPAGLSAEDRARLRPSWTGPHGPPPTDERVELAASVLRAMGLDRDLAPLVLLAGHGSSSTNNPHAAGLDCGACGGQAGDVNARLLAQLLNDPEVRDGLSRRGVDVPASTWFVAGLHDTTTDDVELFETDDVPPTRAHDLAQLRAWLATAGAVTRAERAPSLGLADLAARPAALHEAVRKRARDWAQVRPEWGLAGNAAFVVADRSRTRHLDLEGRVFLHDYDWRRDDGFATLTQVMTAPMVVTNWINLQYYASTVDPDAYGSGNKLLHNVVGGDVGVFEGNGGDLRIGLARQSVHDGERFVHTPLRLSVFVAAPADAIDAVLAAHEAPRSLVENRWLHLFRLTDDGAIERRLPRGGWRPVAHPDLSTERSDRTPTGDARSNSR